MQPFNLFLTFYFVDSRNLDEIHELVGRALTCHFAVFETDEYRDEQRYRAYVFGMRLMLEYVDSWDNLNVYRLAGSAFPAEFTDDSPKISLDHHVSNLLRRFDINTFYTIEEYRRQAELR